MIPSRNKIGAVITGCLLLFASFSFALPAQQEMPKRALWVWDIKTPQLGSASSRLLSFCKRQGIDTVFIACYALPERLEDKYRRFNREAHKKGISVHALSGDPRWTLSRFHHIHLSWAKTILDFNARSTPEERFDGLHSDIEPYGLPEWEKDPRRLLVQYLNLVDQTVAVIEASGSNIVFCLDVPFWWDEEPTMVVEYEGQAKPVIEHIMERVPAIAIMDYRNFAEGPNGSIVLASGEFDIADRTETQIYIGQETQTGLEPAYVTFGGGNTRAMEAEISKLVAAYAGRAGFAGIAIHRFISYRKLLESGP